MYLKRLIEFAEREELVESSIKGFVHRKLDWIIKLTPEGDFEGFIKLEKGTKHTVPYRGRSGGGFTPFLLYDKTEYLLGWTTKEKKVSRASGCHQSFCDLVTQCAKETKEPIVQAVDSFLHKYKMSELIPSDLKDEQWITFQIGNEKPIDLPSVQRFWAEKQSTVEEKKDFQCIICGEFCAPLLIHKTELRLPVAGRDRAPMISANESAYESYGLIKSQISPTCEHCEEKYGRALVELLHADSKRENRIIIGDLVYLFWTKQKGVPVFMPVVQPNPKDVQKLRATVFGGGHSSTSFSATDFYALALSPNKSRIIVRDWQETTLAKVQGHMYDFLQRQRIGPEEKYEGIYTLAASLFRDARKDMIKNVPRLLINHALFGKKLPDSILYRAIQRCRTERKVTDERARVIRLCLTQKKKSKEDYLMTLETSEKDLGYLCGRLFAVLEKIQSDTQNKSSSEARRSINTTITDKYYATASTAPASIFGILMRNAENHLAKLRKDPKKTGWYINHQKKLGEIASEIRCFPKVLKLREQSMFALGYLHQNHDFYKKKQSTEELENEKSLSD